MKIESQKKSNTVNIFILLLLFSFSNLNLALSNNQIENKIIQMKLTQASYDRMVNYIEGNFYSFSENKKITKAIGMYFAISDDGKSTAISYCQDFLMTCRKSLVKARTKMLCERISKIKCTVIFNEDKFLISKKRINKKNIQYLNDYFKIDRDIKSQVKAHHQEIRISNASETSDGSKWDM